MLLPGPEAQQLAVYVGWLSRGVMGGLIAGALFVIPGAFFILGLSWLYANHSELAVVTALFYGVKAAVLAIVAEAVVKIGKRALKSRSDLAIAVTAFLALFFFGVPFPIVVLSAAFYGGIRSRGGQSEGAQSQGCHTGTLATSFVWLVLWLGPLALAWLFWAMTILLRASEFSSASSQSLRLAAPMRCWPICNNRPLIFKTG